MHVCTVQVNWLEQACMQLQLGKLSTNWVNFPDWVHNGRGLTVKPPDLPLDTLMVRSHSFWSKGQNVKLRLNYKNTTLTLNYTVNGANKYILDIKLLGDCLQSHQTHIDIYWAWKWDSSQGKPSNSVSNIYISSIRTLPFVSEYLTTYQGSPSIYPSHNIGMEWSEYFEWLWDQAVWCGQVESSRTDRGWEHLLPAVENCSQVISILCPGVTWSNSSS